MQPEAATRLITNTFDQPLEESQFVHFASNLVNDIDTRKAFASRHGTYIPQAFQGHIRQYKRPFVYYDPDGERLDVLLVRLQSARSLDRARTMQRNFAAWYLKQEHSEPVEAALVAFYHDDVPDWRFSFVRLEYAFGEEGLEEKLTPARRYSFLVGPNEPTHTAEQQLLPLLLHDDQNPTLDDIAAAFRVEVVSKQFFESYKELFLQLVEALQKVVQQDAMLRRDFERAQVDLPNFAKKLLGQIVFLYFVQKKGWLGVEPGEKWGSGPRNFLRRLFARQDGVTYSNFFNDVLEPLFYQALAIQRQDDLFTIGSYQCQIPFLNGGLFEPMGNYDWQNTRLLLPNALFSNRRSDDDDQGTGILDVFDRYNFTVWEEEPLEKEVAVDPEMLGKVFENLLEVQDRKSKGAFYTPREIVHYMCQESLINYLHTQIGPISTDTSSGESDAKIGPISREDITTLVRQGALALQQDAAKEAGLQKGEYVLPASVRAHAAALDAALADIKLCDPAIGSGAFPVGMLHEIVQAREALTTYLDPAMNGRAKQNRTAYALKRHAIQESIYGVDIDPGAVEIAKLRLWLSLVVDEENYDDIQPLPNLDYKIVQGNSLLRVNVKPDLFNNQLFVQIEKLKQKFFAETHRYEKQKLRTQINLLLTQLAGHQNVFDFEIYFNEVFQDKGGFDVVIANPPYVKEYTNRHAFDGLRDSPYYQGKMDLWYFFACISIDILRPDGVQCFIAQNNWVTSAGASIFRDKVRKEARIETFIDFGNYQVFESASIQTMIFLIRKSKKEQVYPIRYSRLNSNNISVDILVQFLYSNEPTKHFTKFIAGLERDASGDEYITFLPKSISDVLRKISAKPVTYLKNNEAAQGIVAPQDFLNGKNAEALGDSNLVGKGVFVLSIFEMLQLKLNSREKDLVKPYYTSSELNRYCGNPANNYWIIYSDSSVNKKIGSYPNIKKHLDQFIPIITSSNKPYGLHRAREEEYFLGEKIMSLRKCDKPHFTYTNYDCYVSQTFFVVKTSRLNLKFLTALFNSKVIEFWLRYKGKMQGDNYQIDKAPLLKIPLKQPSRSLEEAIVKIFDSICQLLSENS